MNTSNFALSDEESEYIVEREAITLADDGLTVEQASCWLITVTFISSDPRMLDIILCLVGELGTAASCCVAAIRNH